MYFSRRALLFKHVHVVHLDDLLIRLGLEALQLRNRSSRSSTLAFQGQLDDRDMRLLLRHQQPECSRLLPR